ncbi:hypothetical protein Salat_1370800 [Sesamum alatum]|uniref:DUF4283 domain-containing protein n=1 Tax=Sesamum alatum TaxID=300844 RepID=A0AAE1Y992_9LAMI|nr:hypothetical protein Salat_1370800 [Sesamum alatum]
MSGEALVVVDTPAPAALGEPIDIMTTLQLVLKKILARKVKVSTSFKSMSSLTEGAKLEGATRRIGETGSQRGLHGIPMRLLKWSPNFTMTEESPIAPVWVNLLALPIHLFDKTALFSITRLLGSPLKIDDTTTKGSRPGCAKICDLDACYVKNRGGPKPVGKPFVDLLNFLDKKWGKQVVQDQDERGAIIDTHVAGTSGVVKDSNQD